MILSQRIPYHYGRRSLPWALNQAPTKKAEGLQKLARSNIFSRLGGRRPISLVIKDTLVPRHSSPLCCTRAFSSPSFTKGKTRRGRKFIPRKAAVQLTEKAREFFKALLSNSPGKDGIILNYEQASSGQPRMVFSFGFVSKDQLSEEDEGVSLEILEDGTPKSPRDSIDDGLPKLYIHHNAFLKVLGGTLDVDTEKITPILYDREGNIMDPNA